MKGDIYIIYTYKWKSVLNGVTVPIFGIGEMSKYLRIEE